MLKNIKTNQSKETMKNDTMPKTTIINSYKRIIDINKIDVSFRDLQNNDNQFEIMKFILNCLILFRPLRCIRKRVDGEI